LIQWFYEQLSVVTVVDLLWPAAYQVFFVLFLFLYLNSENKSKKKSANLMATTIVEKQLKQQQQRWRERGRICYQNNPCYRDLANVMTHPELRTFVDKYLLDPSTFAVMLMLMRAVAQTPRDLDPYEIIGVIDEGICRPEIRSAMARETTGFISDTRARSYDYTEITHVRRIEPTDQKRTPAV
jgi:hypothetical protein